MTHARTGRAWILLAISGGLLPGCLSPGRPFATHYILTADREELSAGDSRDAEDPMYRLALERIEVPAYLQTEWIAVRVGDNEITFDEERRWAEPLGDGVLRLVREGLQRSPKVAAVEVPPFRSGRSVDYRVRVRLLSFEGETEPDGGSAVRVEARWRLTSPEGRSRRGGRFAARDSWDGETYGELASQLSRSLLDLCADIEKSLGEDG